MGFNLAVEGLNATVIYYFTELLLDFPFHTMESYGGGGAEVLFHLFLTSALD